MLFGFTTATFDHISDTRSFDLLPLHEVLRTIHARTGAKTNITYVREWLQAKSMVRYLHKHKVVDEEQAVPQAALAYKPFTTLAGAYHVVSRVNPTSSPQALEMLHELHAHCVKKLPLLDLDSHTLASLSRQCLVRTPAARYRAANVLEYFDTPPLTGTLTDAQIVGFALLGKDHDPLKDRILALAADDSRQVEEPAEPAPRLIDTSLHVPAPTGEVDLSWID